MILKPPLLTDCVRKVTALGSGTIQTIAGKCQTQVVCCRSKGFHRSIPNLSSLGSDPTLDGVLSQGDSGDGGLATSAGFVNPTGIATDPFSGNIFVSDYSGRIRMINTSGYISTVAGSGSWGTYVWGGTDAGLE